MPSPTYTLRLYVAGGTALDGTALRAVELLRSRWSAEGAEVEIEVVDVLAAPDRAEEDRILATPTLVRVAPRPVRKIVGDLRDVDEVCSLLDFGPGGARL